MDDLPPRVRDELSPFSASSVFFEEKDVRVLGWAGPGEAEALVAQGGG